MLPKFLACMLANCERDSIPFAYGALRLYNNSGIVRYRFKDYSTGILFGRPIISK